MEHKIRTYNGAKYKVVPIGKSNLFTREVEFSDLKEAIEYKQQLEEFVSNMIVVNEVVVDKKGEFVGWKRLDDKIEFRK